MAARMRLPSVRVMDRTTAPSESAMERGGGEEGAEQPKPRVSVAYVLAAGAAVIKEKIEEEEEEIKIVHEKLVLPQPIIHHTCAALSQPLDSTRVGGAATDEEAAALAAVAVAAVRALAADAPPSAKDSAYWTGKSSFPDCPRGCRYTAVAPAARRAHYKKHHYNVYYAISKLPMTWTELDQWINVQFGEGKNVDRACVLCIPSRRQFAVYLTRIDLLRHIQSTHPVRFSVLVCSYCSQYTDYAPDAAVHQLLYTGSGWPTVAAATTSTVSSPLAFDAPPSNVDEEYWNGRPAEAAQCPRGCSSSAAAVNSRRKHYKRYHYNIYYKLLNKEFTPLERWMNVKFGDIKSTSSFTPNRVCVRCAVDQRVWTGYRNRVELAHHIQEAHPEMFAELAAEYGSMVAGPIYDEEVHGILMNK